MEHEQTMPVHQDLFTPAQIDRTTTIINNNPEMETTIISQEVETVSSTGDQQERLLSRPELSITEKYFLRPTKSTIITN